MQLHERQGSFYAIASGFFFGFIGYFGLSAIHADLSVSTMLFWRFLIGSVLMVLYLLSQRRVIAGSFKALVFVFFSGLLCYGTSTLFYFYSSTYIGSGLAMVVFFCYPVLIMLLNFLLYGQKIESVYYAATAIILSGMLLLIHWDQIALDVSGVVLGLASAFFYAVYIISCKNSKLSPDLSTLMVCLGCMVTSFIAACYDHSFTVPDSMLVWGDLFGIGVIATILPLLLLLQSLKYISSEKASILSVLEPIFVVIFGVLLLNESLLPLHVLGIILILAGALLALLWDKQPA